MQVIREEVHVSDIKVGDCIEHQGRLMTVCRKDIKKGFMGLTIFGNSYRLGRQLVVRATPIHAMPKLTPQAP
jgi:hypothetical protein